MKKADKNCIAKNELNNSGEFNVFQKMIVKHKKNLLLICIAVLLAVTGFAQRTADIGIWGGKSMYFGDMNETAPLQSFHLNLGAYYRYNFDSRVSIRTMILSGKVSEDAFIEGVQWDFDKNIVDILV